MKVFCYENYIININEIALVKKYYEQNALMIEILLTNGKSLAIQIKVEDENKFKYNFFEGFKKYIKKI